MKPFPWQERLLHVPEDVNVFLGGGRGGGKSTGAQLLTLRHEAQYGPRAKQLVVRPDSYAGAGDFEDQVEVMFKAGFPGRVGRNRQEHAIRVAGGGSVEFSALDEIAYDKFQGRQFSQLTADEAGNFTTLLFLDKLRSNLRTPGVPTRLVICANPGGPAHTMLLRRYVAGRTPWVPFKAADGEWWVYAPSTLEDNTAIDREKYTLRLVASTGGDTALAEAWKTGNWSAVSGSFFASVYGDKLILPGAEWHAPSEPPIRVRHNALMSGVVPRRDRVWNTFWTLDWGSSAPSVALACVQPLAPGLVGPAGIVAPPGSVFVVDEIATAAAEDLSIGLGWSPGQVAAEMLRVGEVWNISPTGVGDDARGLDGSTLLQQLDGAGLSLERPRTKDRVSGWVQVKSMMRAALERNPDQPWLLISERCRYLHETLPVLTRDPLRPEDIAARGRGTGKIDHGADALRYGVVSYVDPDETAARPRRAS